VISWIEGACAGAKNFRRPRACDTSARSTATIRVRRKARATSAATLGTKAVPRARVAALEKRRNDGTSAPRS